MPPKPHPLLILYRNQPSGGNHFWTHVLRSRGALAPTLDAQELETDCNDGKASQATGTPVGWDLACLLHLLASRVLMEECFTAYHCVMYVVDRCIVGVTITYT